MVAVASAVAVIAGGEDEFPVDSPEGTVQRYLRAVADRDTTTAYSLLTPELEQRCATLPKEVITRRGEADFRAALEGRVERGSTTEVHVRLTERQGGGPFSDNEWTQSLVFMLQRQDGGWRFVEPPWPLSCRPANFPTGPRPAGT